MAVTPARIVLSSGFSRKYTGGVREFEVEAKTLRDVIKEMDRRYPGLGEHLEEEATVHDIGKIATPAEILGKPGPLSPVELRLVQDHVRTGYDILKVVHVPWDI